MPETIARQWQPIPTVVRTARVQHPCNDCTTPIHPGDRYELTVFPPHSVQEYDVDRWVTWRDHAPRFGPGGEFLWGCDLAAAYREKAKREIADAGVLGLPATAALAVACAYLNTSERAVPETLGGQQGRNDQQ